MVYCIFTIFQWTTDSIALNAFHLWMYKGCVVGWYVRSSSKEWTMVSYWVRTMSSFLRDEWVLYNNDQKTSGDCIRWWNHEWTWIIPTRNDHNNARWNITLHTNSHPASLPHLGYCDPKCCPKKETDLIHQDDLLIPLSLYTAIQSSLI